MLKHTATHRNTSRSLQHIYTHTNRPAIGDKSLHHAVTHCSTLQHVTHTATLMPVGQQFVTSRCTRCSTLQHAATHCNTLHHNTTRHAHCNTCIPVSVAQRFVTNHRNTLRRRPHCTTLHHTATRHAHCNTCVLIPTDQQFVTSLCTTLHLAAIHCNTSHTATHIYPRQ